MKNIHRQSGLFRLCMGSRRLLAEKIYYLKENRGSVFIGLIITMVVIAGLGAAMLPLSATSTRTQIVGNQAQAGYYLAESGMRYIASEFRHSADGLERCAAEDARDNVLKTNHDQTFTVNDKGAYFDLDIVPYYCEVHTDAVVPPNLKAATFGGIPAEIPADTPGYLQIIIKDDECTLVSARHDYYYNSVSISGDDIMFNGITLDGETPTQHDRIFPVCKSAADNIVTKDGNLTFQADTGAAIFPAAKCRFKKNGTGDIYKYEELDLADNMLKGITKSDDPDEDFTLALTADDYIVAERFIKLTSRGSVSSSSATAATDITFNLSVVDSEGGGGNIPIGLFGDEEVEVKNSGQVKSYDSTANSSPSSSTGNGNICSNEEVELKNNAYIDGDVFLGDDGDGEEGEYDDEGATVTGDAPVDVDRVNPYPLTIDFDYFAATNDNNDAGIIDNEISLGNDDFMTLSGKSGGANYYLTDIELDNGSTLNIDASEGPVNIYLTGDLEAKNGSTINFTGNPPDFTIYSNSDDDITFKNSSTFKGAVYAPYADILLHNSGAAYGMFWGETIEVKKSGVVWFDTALTEKFGFISIGGGDSQSLQQ